MPVQITVKATGAQLVRQGLEDVTAEIPKIGRKRIYDCMLRVRTRLRAPVPRPSYPINWDSFMQMIAFFRSGGFGKGIPYRPTGRSSAEWDIVRAGENGYMIENSFDAAVYLFGNYEGARQSNIHAGRRPLFRDVVEDEVQGLPPDIEQAISYYARGKGFR